MSSTQRFDLIVKAVFHTMDEKTAAQALEKLRKDVPSLSCTPFREEPSLEDCLEVLGTATVDEQTKEKVLSTWDNDWDSNEDRDGSEQYWAYAFNTKMFDPILYYLELEFRPLHA